MFYIFPQNKKYTISKDLVVKLNDEIIETVDGKISIEIYGEEKEVSLKWMYGMALWDIRVLPEYADIIFGLEFKEINLKTHKITEDVIPVFKTPILIKDKYRIIPTIPIYAVSSIGEIWDIAEEKIIYPIIRSGYLNLSDPYRNKIHTIHRLVALAWIPNDDFISKPLVNHLDTNKLNCNVTNLEWCDFSYNSRHLIASGQSSQAESYLLLDTHTDEEILFHSVTDLSKHVGLSTIPYLSARIARHAQYVLSKRYLIKSSINNDPWLRDNVLTNNSFKKGKDLIIIEAKNLTTGEVISGTTVELSRCLNININTLDGLRRKFKQHTEYGYIFRDPSYMEWDNIEVITHILKPKEIIAINVDTKEEHRFKSLREAARFLNCDKKNIGRRLNQDKEYKSYIFKTI